VEIETDFRAALRVILAFEDPDLADMEKGLILMGNLYKTQPGNLAAAFAQGVKFLNGGIGGEEEKEDLSLRLFSFEKDAGFIFAAFRQTHGIDLEATDYMHWWKFLALFMDLGSETTFSSLVSLRKRLRTGKASKEEQAAAREMGDLVELPDILTPEEQASEAEFLRLVAEGERQREGNS
jgi:hypothetical protein